MKAEELHTLKENNAIYVRFVVDYVDTAKNLIFGVLPRELQNQRDKERNIVPIRSFRAEDISFIAPETRRPFKEWDVVQFDGLPFIVTRDERKDGFVSLDGAYKVPAEKLTLLLPAEIAHKPKEQP